MATEPITASRSVWMAVMELARNTGTRGAEKIGSLEITRKDFETEPFLKMHSKFILGVRRAFEQETAEKITGSGDSEEADVEINLTIAEAMYLNLVITLADFKGAVTFKKNLWRVLAVLLTRRES